MRFLENIRKQSFWAKDKIEGGAIRKHYSQVEKSFLSPDDFSRERERDQLNKLLSHAKSTVPFYHKREADELMDFPVINKMDIKECLGEFLSSEFSMNILKKTTTSGSTGTPFTVYMDPTKVIRHRAENIFFSKQAGYSLGEKLFYLRVWNEVNKKSRLEQFLLNVIPVEISDLSSTAIDNILNEIIKLKGRVSLLGFGSALESIAIHIASKSIWREKEIKELSGITVMSEHISLEAKRVLSQAFKCQTISRYSNMENGFIAQQVSNGSGFRVNTSSYHVEILMVDSDEPALVGETGRIVVTDLYNFGLPLIRYDTGDLAVLTNQKEDGKLFTYLSSIEGRKVDAVFNTKGQLVSPHSVTNTLWQFPDIKQFQFIQNTRKSYEMRINLGNGEINSLRLIAELKKYFGSDAQIEIHYVDEIPVLSSGKRKKIVNNYHQK